MKKTLLLLTLCFSFIISFAQTVPQGMKYQAVARNLSGNILANQKISLKIDLVTQAGNVTSTQYSEVHNVTTNQLGLFTLTIGEGKVEKGTFSNVPWSTADIWMQVAIKDKSDFVTISNSKLLAVPYAFHAITAERLSMKGTSGTDVSSATSPGVSSANWAMKGNGASNPATDKLGTTDMVDLIVVTNNIERLRVTALGDLVLKNNLNIDKDLNVKGNVKLNTFEGTTDIKGATNLQNTIDVTGASKLKSTLEVTGATTLKNTLDVTGATNLENTVNTVGITTVKNTTNSSNTENGALVVKGGVGIGKNLNVAGATDLSTTLTVAGATTLNNKLDVTGITTSTNNTPSTSLTSGALVVAGGAGIGGNLNVGGTVSFGGESSFGGQLHVTNQTESDTTNTGALIIDGGAGIAKNLNVGGNTEVTGSVSSTGLTVSSVNNSYVATFENKSTENGDGIHIVLGKAKSIYTIPAAPPVVDADLSFRDLLRCDFTPSAKATLLLNIATEGAIEDLKSMAGIAVGAGNMIINFINTSLNLPLKVGPYTTPAYHLSDAIDVTGPINSELNLPISLPALNIPAVRVPALNTPSITIDVPVIPTFTIPGAQITAGFQVAPAISLLPATTVMPRLPDFSIPALNIPALNVLPEVTVMPLIPAISIPNITPVDITSPAFWGIPDICLTEGSGNTSPLNNNNEFIRFSDKNSIQVGSIRAVSVTNWASNFLNPTFFSKLRGAFLSSKVDKFHAQYHFKTEITTALASYAKIGVEYSSGNGDYAEWLERSDKSEEITAGDIVGVIGGKITRNLKEAEQVMVVSHNPIILGNMPAEGKNYEGNNIAFMGQVPVKVLGPVVTGDYIVGQINTPGYGIAKRPKDMKIEDFKNAVGRSWENDLSEGIKMVNTVVGVHNNNFINIIKDLKESTEENDARLKAIEAKLNMTQPAKKTSTKLPASKVILKKQG